MASVYFSELTAHKILVKRPRPAPAAPRAANRLSLQLQLHSLHLPTVVQNFKI